MANTTISPNMNLPVPVPGEDPGPDWANNIVADMYAIDSHNHSAGQGVQITPAGLDINADLPVGSNNVTEARSLRFTAQGSPLALASDLGCLYESGVDLYYNDGAGNQVRMTQSGSVTGSAGTITGLPSGTASASFAAATFTFQSSTNTPATMAVGPLIVGAASASPKTVTIGPSGSQPANYALVLPLALPGATSVVTLDASGNLASTIGPALTTPTITTPAFVGLPTGTITAESFSVTTTWTYVSGGTATFTNTASTWYYQRIGNIVTVYGLVQYNTSAYSGSSGIYKASAPIPLFTTTLNIVGTSTAQAASTTTPLSKTNDLTMSQLSGTTVSANQTGLLIAFTYMYEIN